MKLNELFVIETKMRSKILKTPDGMLEYRWNTWLEEEEHEGYIPDGYSKKVLELEILTVHKPGNGHGDELMRAFMKTTEFKKAELVFLDPVPGMGVNDVTDMSEEEQIRRLHKFYSRFGFRRNPKANRMWLVRKGEIPDNKLPT